MRSESGSDFKGQAGSILDRHGTKHEYIPPSVGELDGAVERVLTMLSAIRQAAREEAHVLLSDTDIPTGLDE